MTEAERNFNSMENLKMNRRSESAIAYISGWPRKGRRGSWGL